MSNVKKAVVLLLLVASSTAVFAASIVLRPPADATLTARPTVTTTRSRRARRHSRTMGPPSISDLLERVWSAERAREREAAIFALFARYARGPAVVRALAGALDDGDRNVRWAAKHVLGAMGPEARAAVPALVRALRDPSRRDFAAWALGAIGSASRAPLAKLLAEGRTAAIRKAAAHGLWVMKCEARDSRAAIVQAARTDVSPLVRRAARITLAGLAWCWD
ncbi:MAG: HEAT repeat domain-containing protein [Myxococcales bacterium]|nr:HEAT repeat domain-containing protein [Myxococcales bacterium]